MGRVMGASVGKMDAGVGEPGVGMVSRALACNLGFLSVLASGFGLTSSLKPQLL